MFRCNVGFNGKDLLFQNFRPCVESCSSQYEERWINAATVFILLYFFLLLLNKWIDWRPQKYTTFGFFILDFKWPDYGDASKFSVILTLKLQKIVSRVVCSFCFVLRFHPIFSQGRMTKNCLVFFFGVFFAFFQFLHVGTLCVQMSRFSVQVTCKVYASKKY